MYLRYFFIEKSLLSPRGLTEKAQRVRLSGLSWVRSAWSLLSPDGAFGAFQLFGIFFRGSFFAVSTPGIAIKGSL